MALNPEQYRLGEDEHQAIFEKEIKPELFAGIKSSKFPTAVIFGGQPSAGKSASVDEAIIELQAMGGAVKVEGDTLRDYHPYYADLLGKDDKTAAFYTDRDTGRWVEKAIAYAKEQRVNLVIEGTMRNPDVVAATMESLREAGYTIDARALAVAWPLSEQGIIQRYENQKADRGVGRMTTFEAHKAAYDGMLHTLDRIETNQLADKITIYRRGGEAIYSNAVENGHWVNAPKARAIVEVERSRGMTLQEHQDYAKGFNTLFAMVTEPERKATADEIEWIEALKKHADAALQQMQSTASGIRNDIEKPTANNKTSHRTSSPTVAERDRGFAQAHAREDRNLGETIQPAGTNAVAVSDSLLHR